MNRAEKIELLAPAGTWEALEAAVYAGADAVYLGGKSFGARQYADNFDQDGMIRAVHFAHLHRVRIYVTVNTLVDDSETDELTRYLLFLHNIGVDGIIVQDLGVVRIARTLVPDLPVHASTQMTLTNSAGVEFAQSLGITRSVLARELSLKEISAAAEKGEIECFIHGALCMCYSGQCLMSSLIGGRSGNRGRCAQPCRLPYRLTDKNGTDLLAGRDVGQYLLSPKDMNTLDILPQMLEAGVTSLKIEGRMKRPEYVAVVVDCYRRAIDSYLAGNYYVSAEDRANIEQIFNRDFTTAYLEKRPGRMLLSDRRPNNRGVLVGRVAKLARYGEHKNQTGSFDNVSEGFHNGLNSELIKLEKELHLGDGLEFWVTQGGRVGITVEKMLRNGAEITVARPGDLVQIGVPKGVRLNDRVFRTLDNALMQYAQSFYGQDFKRRIPVDVAVEARLGQPLQIKMTDDEGTVVSGETDFIVEAARKHPLDEATVRKQMDRLGTTEYTLRNLQFIHDENVMVPLSEINEARRLATERLDAARIEKFAPRRKRATSVTGLSAEKTGSAHRNTKNKGAILAVHCDTLEKVQVALQCGAKRIIYGGDCFTSTFSSLSGQVAVGDRVQPSAIRNPSVSLTLASPPNWGPRVSIMRTLLNSDGSPLNPASSGATWSEATRRMSKAEPVGKQGLRDADYEAVVQMCRQAGAGCAFATPRIVKEYQLPLFRKFFAQWSGLKPDYVYINNNSLAQLAKEYPDLHYWADHSLNIYNTHSLDFWQERGMDGASLSNELTLAQVEHLCKGTELPLECLVQGRIEMMVSEYCAGGALLGNLHQGPCVFQCAKQLYLEDRQKAKFPLATDQYCRMHVLNSVETSMAANIDQMLKAGVKVLKIDARFMTAADTANMTALYRDILNGTKILEENLPDTTRGHYFRGVL